MEIINLQQGTSDWHDFRKQHIGASEAPIILGLSPYKTPYGLLQEKLTGKSSQVNDYILQKGHEMEEKARHLFELALETTITPLVCRSEKWPFLTASLDGITEDKVLWEHKLVGLDDYEAIKGDKCPDKFFAQLQQQMLVTGSTKAILAASYDPPEGYSYTSLVVHSDIEYQVNTLLPSLINFWDAMQGKVEIEPSDKDCVDYSDNEHLYARLTKYRDLSLVVSAAEAEMKAIQDEVFKIVPARGICRGIKMTKSKGKPRQVIDYDRLVYDLKIDTTPFTTTKPGNTTRRITFATST